MKADGPPAQGEDSIMIEKPNENPKAVDWFSEAPIKKGVGPKVKRKSNNKKKEKKRMMILSHREGLRFSLLLHLVTSNIF